MNPQPPDETRKFSQFLFSWRGLAVVLAVLLLGPVIAGMLSVGDGKPFLSMRLSTVLLVYSAACFVAAGWFNFAKPKKESLPRIVLMSLAFAVLGAFTGYYVAQSTSSDPTPPMSERLLRTGPIFLVFAVVTGLVMALVMVARSRESAARSRVLELEATSERAARLASEAELRALQAQIEPHFLFNTLSSAQYLASTRDPRAADLLARLNQLLRGTLEATRKRSATLTEELALARSYLAIAQLRLGDRLQVDIDVPNELPAVVIPPATLLTLLENAIEHGIEPSLRGGRISVVARPLESAIRIEICNTGERLRLPIVEGIGLRNVRQRLDLLCGDTSDLDLHCGEDGRTIATLLLPIRATNEPSVTIDR